jgi:carbon storage regulator CsrA
VIHNQILARGLHIIGLSNRNGRFVTYFSKGMYMLVLSRKQDQEIVIGDGIKITVLKIKGNTIRLGIEAPRDVKIIRGELAVKPEINHEKSEKTPEANVTIVFSNDPASPQANLDVIPFRKGDLSNAAIRKPQTGDSQASSTETSDSFSFRARLPKTLQHNRLKEIVKQVTRNR